MLYRIVGAIALVAMLVPNHVDATPQQDRQGFAAHYRVGLMERVARKRGMPIVRCMIASSYYALDTWLWVTSEVTGETEHCRITDVTAPQHVATVRRRNIVIEFGASNIFDMCGFREVNAGPPSSCPVWVRDKQ